MRFCPSCGRDSVAAPDVGDPGDPGDPYAQLVNDRSGIESPTPSPTAVPRQDTGASKDEPPIDTTGTTDTDPMATIRRYVERASRAPSVVIGALIVFAGLVIFGLLMRPQPGNAPASVPGGPVVPGASVVAGGPALIVGLTIESPADGQVIATKDVTVIGLAPPGLGVTRDVSFGLDQHATADGTGHWAINVGLNEGENKLKFRIGDDHSTEKELRVTYTPQAP
jgi:hypothetical protein